ncbi:3'(2'),5'-bisphosphate nucleotidase [Podosphaera aphanis]|nr:3'(2'),5'-bisphosphate nucleotidase [Podosphaera aphanis]
MSSYTRELEIAQLAVQRATILTKKVFYEKEKGTISKDDTSPVTIGDFGAQALIIHAIKKNFPGDQIVGEEEASSLRKDQNLRDVIWDLVKDTTLIDSEAETALGGPILSIEDMLDSIDQGNSTGGNKGRIWALDPIDGTKGFLRGGQYAVCLALMVEGDVKVGVLGCPNLPVDDSALLTVELGFSQTNPHGKGILISAISGQGAMSRPLSTGGLEPSKSIKMRQVKDISQTIFCESVEKAHSSHDIQDEIAKKLGICNPGVQMDSQAKYASLARGMADIYLRLTLRPDYQEKIWDHAAGDVIVREAGGEVTDIFGRRLDFGRGRTLAENKGVIAASKAAHAEVLKAVKEILVQKQRM